jgi:hypothetical protein
VKNYRTLESKELVDYLGVHTILFDLSWVLAVAEAGSETSKERKAKAGAETNSFGSTKLRKSASTCLRLLQNL